MRDSRRMKGWLLALSMTFAPAGPAGAGPDETAAKRGRQLYAAHCAECHGKEGRGDGEKAERLGFAPRDFTFGAFKCRSTPTGGPPTVDDLRRIIERGLPGTPMTGLGDELAADETTALVGYLETLFPAPAAGPGEAIEIPPPPVPGAVDAAAGAAIYGLLRCWSCHGVDGRGRGPAADALEDTWGEPIKVYDFTKRSRYKCGGSDEDLYRTLHTGMTGSPMPSFTAAFGFAADRVGDLSALEEALGRESVASLMEWLATQPTAEAIGALDAAERRALVEERTWQLIAYLRSLERE